MHSSQKCVLIAREGTCVREMDSLVEPYNLGVPQLPNPYSEGAYRAHSDGFLKILF